MRKRWYAIAILGVIIPLSLYGLLSPGNAVVEAQVNLTAPYGNGFLQQVHTTHAWTSRSYPEGMFFEVWSKCSLSVNQIIDIKVPVSGLIFGGQPTSYYQIALYKKDGIGYVPWDGC